MDWFLGCFRCGQRCRPGRSEARLESKKGGSEIAVFTAADFLSTDSVDKVGILHDGSFHHEAQSFELGKVVPVPGSGLARTASGRRHCSTSGSQFLLVEKLEEKINNLNEKLVEETSQARSLTNEVRHLRQCSKLLDSTDAFSKVLDALENASEKVEVEDSPPLLYLQSMLSKIVTTELLDSVSAPRTDERMSECSEEESFSLISIDKDHNCVEETDDEATLSVHQAKRSPKAVSVEEGPKHNEEHLACISVCQTLSEVANVEASVPQLPSLLKRRSSTTFSFSGFIVFENELEDTSFAEHSSSSGVSVTKIIETPDTSSENLVEASKSLFAFATTSSKSDSISKEQSLPQIGSEEFCFLTADSEVESCLNKGDSNMSLCKVIELPSCLQAANTQGSYWGCSGTNHGELKVEISAESYDGFSDESSHKLVSSSGRGCLCSKQESTMSESEVLQLQRYSIEDKGSAKKCADLRTSASQSEDIDGAVSRNLKFVGFSCSAEVQAENISKSKGYAEGFSLMQEDSLNNSDALVLFCEAKNGSNPLYLEGARGKALQKMSNFFDQEKLSDTHTAASYKAKLLENKKCIKRVTLPYMESVTSCSSVSQDEVFTLVHDSAMLGFSSGEALSLSSPRSVTSQYPSHTLSPLPQVGQDRNTYDLWTPSTPTSVNSQALIVSLCKDDFIKPDNTPLRAPLSKDDKGKPDYTLLRTPSASLSHTETPNSTHSQGSPTILDEDRPILGTVAAHWNSSSSSTKKWWDGKGIPNSTNKYKEDQKVSWHATPFEVRLERAISKQGRMFQKKLFIGGAEMEILNGLMLSSKLFMGGTDMEVRSCWQFRQEEAAIYPRSLSKTPQRWGKELMAFLIGRSSNLSSIGDR
ncbi:hypothetical protein L7F22_059254 [Adiantum nelumboides]|nr:hypothetical protein [Adiantum nelumboides]